MRTTILAAAVLGLGALSATQANAVTQSCSIAGPGGTTYSLSNATGAECFAGNDTNTIDAAFEMFGLTGWVLSDKSDDANGDGTIEFTDAPVSGDDSGDWTIDTLAGLSNVVITLKAGNNFGAFLLDLTVADPLSGLWEASRDLSHASIYYNGTPPDGDPPPVPLPAALPLLLTSLVGLGILGGLKRRRT